MPRRRADAEVLDKAREFARRDREINPLWKMSGAKIRFQLYRDMADQPRVQADIVSACIAESRSSKAGWKAMVMIADDYQKRHGGLSPELASWAMDRLTKRVRKPPTGAGKTDGQRWAVQSLVLQVATKFGLSQNQACEVVYEASHISAKHVQRLVLEGRQPLIRADRNALMDPNKDEGISD